MNFKYDEYGSLEHITFQGLNGCEPVRDLKNALELLKIENPKRTFQDRVKAGEFDNTSDDGYEQIVDAVDFAASLWRYPDAQVERRQCLIYDLYVGNVGNPFPTNYL